MFKTTQELQDFILWCRQAKIKAVKVGDMEVQFSDLAFIDAISELTEYKGEEERNTSKTLHESPDPSEIPDSEEDLLFLSAQ